MSSIDFTVNKQNDPRDHIKPMHKLRAIAEKTNFTSGDKFSTVWSKYFAMWITDEVSQQSKIDSIRLLYAIFSVNWQGSAEKLGTGSVMRYGLHNFAYSKLANLFLDFFVCFIDNVECLWIYATLGFNNWLGTLDS